MLHFLFFRRALAIAVLVTGSVFGVLPATAGAQPATPPLIQDAQKLADAGKHDEALALYQKALSADRKSMDAHLGAGRALDFLGRHAEARRSYQAALELAPPDGRAQPLSATAVSYAFESNAPGAARFYQMVFDERIAAGNPGGAAGTANALGRVYLETGDRENAEKWYRTGYDTSKRIANATEAERDLWTMRWLNAQGRIAARRGNAAEARRHAAALAELLAKGQNEGERPQLQYLLGYIALEAGEHDRAIAELEKGNLTDTFVLGLIGRAYEKKGDAANARAYYAKVLASPGHSLNTAFARRWAQAYLKPATPSVTDHGQHGAHGAAPADAVGSASVNFETSCAPPVRADFNRAVALLHSFWFAEAIGSFNRVLASDPACAMAHWGIALSHWGNPFAGIRAPQQIELGRAAILKAQATGSPTPRERAYIDAAAALFTDGAAGTQRSRTVAYAEAMEKLARANPSDMEAQIFAALALNQTAQPTDKTYAPQLKAAGVLEPLFKQHPSHPGLAHYIIHAYDHPPLAPKALDAARRYASLAPAVPHALHMPSHTFTRVGLWKESIETNRKSADAARKSSTAGEELHALDYQAYAYLQIARDADARAVLDRALTLVQGADGIAVGGSGVGAFAVAAIPARYALERGAWAEAAALTVRPAKTPHTEAMTHFARALGAARGGNPKAALADIERLAALRDTLNAMPDAYWAEQVDIQRRVALAWVAFAEGRREAAIADLRAAADAEDATDKSAVSPGPLAPARELLGFMLLDAGRPADALAAFEASLTKDPNRFRGLYGAGRAAEAAGDRAKAAGFYKQLLELAAETRDSPRAELQHARKFTGAKPR